MAQAQSGAPNDAQALSPRSPMAGGGGGAARAQPAVMGTLSEADLDVLGGKKVAVFGSFQVCGNAE